MATRDLLDVFPHAGRLEWIGRSPARRAPIEVLGEVALTVDGGIEGDYHARASRHVTLIQAEHLPLIGAWLRSEAVRPEETRRNLVVSGLNLLSLKDRELRIGEEVVLRHTGACAPCSFMERTLGEGGYNAMRGHGGINCEVLRGGTIRVGDEVRPVVRARDDRQLQLDLQ